jgi:hypothetical protein
LGGAPIDAADVCPFSPEELIAPEFDARAALEHISRKPAPRP